MKNKAIGFYKSLSIEDQDVFLEKEIPLPLIQEYDLLVKVEAVAINPIDIKLRKTNQDPTTFHILGFDACGEVIRLGEKVKNFKVGDRVYYVGSIKRPGANQTIQAVDARIVAKAPKTLTSAKIAALPLTSITAWELLFEKFGLIPKQQANKGNILLINAGGGVGSVASQLARWAGLTVYGTASPKNFNWLKRNGVKYTIDRHQPIVPQIVDLFDYVAVFYDISSYLTEITQLIKPFGKIGTIVNTAEKLNLNGLKNLSVDFHWEYMFTKTDVNQRIETQGAILAQIASLCDEGKLKTTLNKVFPSGLTADNLREATDLVEKGIHGKVVVVASDARD